MSVIWYADVLYQNYFNLRDFAFKYLISIPSGKWIHWEIFSNTKFAARIDANTSMKVLPKDQLQD